jgi:hypothetical protein
MKKTFLAQHDNAQPHTVCLTSEVITKNGWEVLLHSACIRDLASLDYYLFGVLKDHMRGQNYENNNEVQNCVELVASLWNIFLLQQYH